MLLAGVVAGALAVVGAGVLLNRRDLVAPTGLAAARLLTEGNSPPLTPGPSSGAEDLTDAVSVLTAALAKSESRQRNFLLSVSHDLRTPLTTLKGYAEALSDGAIEPEEAQRAGALMLLEADRLDRMVTDLLLLARLEATDFPLSVLTVDLAGLIRETAEAWGARLAVAGLVLGTELPAVPVMVHTDPGRLREVIDRLLNNAVGVLQAGSHLVLALYPPERPSGSEKDSTIDTFSTRRWVTLELRDGRPRLDGEGLTITLDQTLQYEQHQEAWTKNSSVNLAIAATLAQKLGGATEVGRALGGGVRFIVRLPIDSPLVESRRLRSNG